ncbi:MAG: hypothetical protein ACK56I_04770, partial [bacterium]
PRHARRDLVGAGPAAAGDDALDRLADHQRGEKGRRAVWRGRDDRCRLGAAPWRGSGGRADLIKAPRTGG